MMKGKKLIATILLLGLLLSSAFLMLAGCTDKGNSLPKMADTAKISSLSALQTGGDMVFEWLGSGYKQDRPTLVVIPGESTDSSGERFSMKLDDSVYTSSATVTTGFVVNKDLGYKKQGFKHDLSHYWLDVARYNVVVFHWERFADESNSADILAKFFGIAKMRYRMEDGTYETSAVPNVPLVELLAALYLKEMTGKLSTQEIRFVGNGTGATLALCLATYLNLYCDDGQVPEYILPYRLALCDPYFPFSGVNINIPWAKSYATDYGMLSAANDMISYIARQGVAVEMIEMREVSQEEREVENENGVPSTQIVDVYKYAYEYEKSEKAEGLYSEIKENVAYLEYTQNYTLKTNFNSYKDLRRIALDWYLYSIVGSDDTSVGYPRDNVESSYSGCNWANNETRPIVNNRQPNNDASTSAASSRGKNFGLSAWTPTVYTRALRGTAFTQKKYSAKSAENDLHGNAVYTYTNYVMTTFRSENYQLSEEKDYTLLCGYVYLDENKDFFRNDGVRNGIAGAHLLLEVKYDNKTVETRNVYADKDGFYTIRLEDKTVLANGSYSEKGYRFGSTSHEFFLTYIPSSNRYYHINSALSGLYCTTVNGHNFSKFAATVTINSNYADAITISNCLVVRSE